MFGFFKRKKSVPKSDEPAARLLSAMGFDLTQYGVGVMVASGMSGYSPAETASLIALVTIARDVLEGEVSTTEDTKRAMHTTLVIKALHKFKAEGMMRDDLYNNDVNALQKIGYINAESEDWARKVLNRDPIAGKERLAVRTSIG